MNHHLTIGHLDTTLVADRGSRVLRPLEERILQRHLKKLGERKAGVWTLGGRQVQFQDGCVSASWLVGRGVNRVAEEFVLRMQRDTGCQIIDRSHGRIIEPGQLTGLPELEVRRPFFAATRRLLKTFGL